jgi:hypothetical protein
MASSISLPSFAAKTSNILNADGTPISQSFAPTNGGMFRNRVINGNFDIWQRGTSQTSSGYGSVDRFSSEHSGSTKTTSRQAFTLGQTDVPNNPQYFMRTVVSSVAGAGNFASIKQSIEGVRNFAGQTATLSFWAKADASKNIAVEFTQSFGTGGSPSAFISGISVTTVALTSAWQKIIVTVNIPSIAGKTLGTNGDDSLTVNIWFEAGSTFNSRSNSLGQQSGTFDISQIQIEQGSSATPFEVRPIGLELNLCHRYYASTGRQDMVTVGGRLLLQGHGVLMRSTPTVSVSETRLLGAGTLQPAPTWVIHSLNGRGYSGEITYTSTDQYSLYGITFSAEL